MSKREHIIHPSSPLPPEYRQLEYIESTGTQYIRTGVIPTLDIEWYLDFQATAHTSATSQGSIRYTNNSFALLFDIYQNQFRSQFGQYPNQWNENFEPVDTNRHLWHIKNGLVEFDNEVRTHTLFTSINNPTEVYLFARNDGNASYKVKEKIFRCQFVGLRDYLPALRLANSKPGLYDLVNSQFYTNSGTGEFLYN